MERLRRFYRWLQLKFRKLIDIKREKELEAKRKNEKIRIGPEHPVRKLLERIRDRHAQSIASPMFDAVDPQTPTNEYHRVSWEI